MLTRVARSASLIAVSILLFGGFLYAQRAHEGAGVFSQMKFRYIGPPGNRAISVASIPGNPQIYYVGAASGGIFKTMDGGIHWEPIFDAEPVSSVGAIAIAPSDPNIVWAGTGEPYKIGRASCRERV